MKLSKFKYEKMSITELTKVRGGYHQEVLAIAEGTSHTTRHSTSCTGTDHDSGRHDSD